MNDCYVVITYRGDPRWDSNIFEGHIGLDDNITPERLKRTIEDMAFSWGYDNDEVEVEVHLQDRDFDWVVPDETWLKSTARDVLLSSGDLTEEEEA
jgi:hypothetical protein